MRANLSRRTILAAGGLATLTAAARAAGGFGNPDLPAEGAVNVTNPKALTDPGPQDEWAYFLKGTARMTVFNTGPAAMTADFHPGDIGYVKKGLGHYIENTGNTDLVFMEVFRAERFEEVLLADWLAHSPTGMVAETLNLDPSVIAQFPKNRPDIVPA
jgi:oxalate decarboxylase/phosphoglucose isomerase-like protein (cupin superfamily)